MLNSYAQSIMATLNLSQDETECSLFPFSGGSSISLQLVSFTGIHDNSGHR